MRRPDGVPGDDASLSGVGDMEADVEDGNVPSLALRPPTPDPAPARLSEDRRRGWGFSDMGVCR